MDIILVPGLWLDGSSWDEVAATLAEAGHRPRPLTLPGMEDAGADRSTTGLEDHVVAVVKAIDEASDDGPVMLVGHSAGGGVVHAAADRRPGRISRIVHVGGFPAADGESLVGGFAVEGDDLPMPPWDRFDDADLVDLDAAARRRFRDRAIPSPARLATDTVVLTDVRRLDIPTTVVATEFTSEQLVGWLADGHLPELDRVAHLEFVDLPTGHWPQFTRPVDLARLIADRTEPTVVDDQGRLEPPGVSSELLTTLGFLDYQRETLAWKTRGLDASGLGAKTAASDLTLGGLLKHMAFVEDHWFSYRLLGRERSEPWQSVDWKAEPDWEFTSAGSDDPADLRAMWEGSVRRSKALAAGVIASGGLGAPAVRPAGADESVSLRWILTHMIEEYARHNGHADLLREAVDGEVGE